jgi:DNA-binding transcriptional regulator YdaS (Cro superfamily)
MASYANGVQPIDGLYDGFLIHSRGSNASALGEGPANAAPNPTMIRTDLDVPVLQFETETDLLRLGFLKARQPDTDSVRTWEVAGTAHADQATLDAGAASGSVWYSGPRVDPAASCGTINNGPSGEVLRAALAGLLTWIEDGTPPPTSPLIETTTDDIVTDAAGNALGGIRTPAVDAPVSALSGKGNPSSVFCSLFGQRRDFGADELAALYPDNDAYVAAVTTSADAATSAGFLLEPERVLFIERAETAQVP